MKILDELETADKVTWARLMTELAEETKINRSTLTTRWHNGDRQEKLIRPITSKLVQKPGARLKGYYNGRFYTKTIAEWLSMLWDRYEVSETTFKKIVVRQGIQAAIDNYHDETISRVKNRFLYAAR